jgi:hypothetical protein
VNPHKSKGDPVMNDKTLDLKLLQNENSAMEWSERELPLGHPFQVKATVELNMQACVRSESKGAGNYDCLHLSE